MNFRDKLAVVDDTMAMARPEETAVAKAEATVHRRPEVVDDFIRNFFVKMGMKRSLESFEVRQPDTARDAPPHPLWSPARCDLPPARQRCPVANAELTDRRGWPIGGAC